MHNALRRDKLLQTVYTLRVFWSQVCCTYATGTAPTVQWLFVVFTLHPPPLRLRAKTVGDCNFWHYHSMFINLPI